MLKDIPKDIYEFLENPKPISDSAVDELARALADTIRSKTAERGPASPGLLRMSQYGQPCKRKLWYGYNQPEKAEPLNGKTYFKFLYGDILELVTLWLIKLTGKHKVVGEQDEITYEGIVGHRDAIVDGVLVDVKSANARGMVKFTEHQLDFDDPFGYRDQLSLYSLASREDPMVEIKKEAAFIAVDKENGDIVVDVYKTKEITREDVERTKQMLSQADPPPRHYKSVADGKSGNEAIPFQCSYCQYKHHCWPGLRGFLYSTGIRWLNKVVKQPDVWEIPKQA